MKLIAITSPSFCEGEASFLNEVAAEKFDLIHLRKPDATAQECSALIEKLTDATRRKVVVHQHFEQALQFGLHGIHLNHRHPVPPPGYHGSVSRSCHSLEEVVEWKERCDYVFLSPIFDSISKSGYRAAFAPEMLSMAANDGIIDAKVCALGGVSPSNLHLLEQWNFGGAAMLGYVEKLQNDFANSGETSIP